jgi:hypothetical protein
MNDVERELRELFERKAASVGGVAPRPPETVRKRGRRRQLGTALVGGLTVVALVVGSVAVLRSVDAGHDRRTVVDDPWAGYAVFERTATVADFTITSPSDWYLVNQWPWARMVATSLREQRERDTKACGEEPTPDERQACRSALMGVPGDGFVTPILMLSDTDRGLESSPCFGPGFSIGPEDAVMTVALDSAYMAANFGAGDRARWPVPFDTPPAENSQSCGPGTYVYFAAGDIPYVTHFAFGDEVPEDERQTLIRAFEEMHVDDSQEVLMVEPKPDDSATYVIAGGENAAGPWTLELTPSPSDDPAANVVLRSHHAEGGAVGLGDTTVPDGMDIDQAGGDPVFGFVTKEATGVEIRLEEGAPSIPAQIVPLPPSLPFEFDLFFASHEADAPAIAVALDRDGRPLDRVSSKRCEPLAGVRSEHTIIPSSGPSGSSAAFHLAIPTSSETGRYIRPLGEVQIWWNLDPRSWSTALPGGDEPTPQMEGRVVKLGSIGVEGLCEVDGTIVIPDVGSGTYPIVAILTDGDGASLILPADQQLMFSVTN